jgi:hypothetical protein
MTVDTGAALRVPETTAALRLVGAPPELIRARPIPDISPPTIDSRVTFPGDLSPFIQGTLAISFSGGSNPGTDLPDPEKPEYFRLRRSCSDDLPEPDAWVRHIAQALIEVMSGARPAPQVIRWTTPEIYSAVARRNAAAGRRTLATRRAIVRQVRICEPVDGVIEACAVVVDNGRVRALAMRLTGVDRRWVVTELQVG